MPGRRPVRVCWRMPDQWWGPEPQDWRKQERPAPKHRRPPEGRREQGPWPAPGRGACCVRRRRTRPARTRCRRHRRGRWHRRARPQLPGGLSASRRPAPHRRPGRAPRRPGPAPGRMPGRASSREPAAGRPFRLAGRQRGRRPARRQARPARRAQRAVPRPVGAGRAATPARSRSSRPTRRGASAGTRRTARRYSAPGK